MFSIETRNPLYNLSKNLHFYDYFYKKTLNVVFIFWLVSFNRKRPKLCKQGARLTLGI